MNSRLDLLQALLNDSPNDSFALFATAKEYEKMGDTTQALAHYLRLRDTNPAYVGLYYHLGKLYEMLQEPENALATYRQGCDVARAAKDFHALGELNGARLALDDED
jgi:tetratricopeptide (TPR) repeat protein